MKLPAEIILKAIDKVSGPLKRIGMSARLMSKDTKRSLQAVGGAARRLGLGLAGVATGVMVATGVASAKQETLLGKLASEGVKNLELYRRKAEEVSDEFAGMTGDQFLESALTIARGLTKLADKTKAEISKITAQTALAVRLQDFGQANKSFNKFYSNFRDKYKDLSDTDFAKFWGGLVSGGVEFGIEGEDMLKLLDGIGAEAAASGQDVYELFGVAGLLSRSLKSSKAGVSSTEQLMRKLAKAGGKLGIPFLNEEKKLKSIPVILGLIKRVYGETINELDKEKFNEAFGEEGAKVIHILLKKIGELPAAAAKMKKSFSMTGFDKMLAKFKVQNEGVGESWSRVTQSLLTMAAAIGKVLSPVLLPLIDKTQEFVKWLREAARRHPELIQAVIMGAFVIGGLTAALGTLTVAMFAFNAAVWANPLTWKIMLIVAAIGGLVAAGYYLWRNWRKIWENLKTYVVDAVATLLSALALVVMWNPATWGIAAIIAGVAALAVAAVWLYNNWNKVLTWFNGALEEVLAGFTRFADFMSSVWDALVPDSVAEAGARVIKTYLDGFKAGWKLVQDWFDNAINGLLKLIPASVRKVLGLKVEAEAKSASHGVSGSFGPQVPVAQAMGKSQVSPPGRVDGLIKLQIQGPQGTRVVEFKQGGNTGIGVDYALDTLRMMP